jgi:hypothetical protein
MSSRQRRFRPALETLEGRDVPTAISFLGYNTPGMWGAGSERVSFFAVDFHGSFTYANAQQAWSTAVARSVSGNFSLDTSAAVDTRTGPQDHLLIGWYDLDEHRGGWMAADYVLSYGQLVTTGPWWNRSTHTETHSTMNWMSNDGQSGRNVEGWKTLDYTTYHGYHVDLALAPNPNGHIYAYFTAPYSVAE